VSSNEQTPGEEPAVQSDVVASDVPDGSSGGGSTISLTTAVLVVAGGALVVVIFLWNASFWHWVEVHTGIVNEAGPYYAFWSGFGSDLGEATLLVGAFTLLRHHNCHVKRCIRLGRSVDGTPYVACPKHHPASQGCPTRHIS
jgi:hypothetical protein